MGTAAPPAKLAHMGLTDVLFGRKKLKAAAGDRLFALSTAAVTLDLLGLKTAGVAAVVFSPVSAPQFTQAQTDLDELLVKVAADAGSKIDRKKDSLGYEWLAITDPDLEDQVTTAHLVASELQTRGFGDRLLAAAFKFTGDDNPVFWIYGFKLGTFWPFIPTGGADKLRNNARELELKSKLEGELPVEQNLGNWFGLFDAPI